MHVLHCQTITVSLTVLMILIASPIQASGQDAVWPQFRGPDANPVADNPRLPQHWSTTESVEWSTEIPGRGWSSPIVAGGKIILTTVVTEGDSKPPQVGTEYSNEYVAELMKQGLSPEEVKAKVTARDIELPHEVTLRYLVLCLDLDSGDVLWQDEFHTGQPPGGRHRKNSFASETAVTDGNHVYVYVASLGLFAYDLEGNRVWTKQLEAHPIYLDFGTGSSPVLYQDRLIIVHDNETQGFIAAFDKSDGREIWRTERAPADDAPAEMPKSSWATPYVWENEIRTEIVTLQPGIAISYDTDGQELWRMKGVSIGPASSSFASDGLLFLNGGKGQPMFALRPGALGDISPDESGSANEHVVWTRPQAGTYIPSAVAYQGGLYVVKDNGILTRFDVDTGEESFKARIKAEGADFTASPWAYNGNVFCLSEQGDTYVIRAGESYDLLHVNALEDMAMATPAIVGDRLLIRTEKRMYSIRQAD